MLPLLALAALGATPPIAEETPLQLDMVTVDMLRTTCDGGDAAACHRLGRRYDLGNGGVATSAAEAARWYGRACDLGVLASCGLGAVARAHLGEPAAYALAKKACDGGDIIGCYALGHLEVVGLGVTANPSAGLGRVKAGCDAGIPNACSELGMLYAGAVPALPADFPRAVPLLETACTAGEMDACGWLGFLLVSGKGTPAAPTRGISVLDKACSGNVPVACENVAAVYIQGLGVTADVAKAVPYLRKACDGKLPASCAQLAGVTLQGLGGVTADRSSAIAYAKKACSYGNTASCTELDDACRAGAKEMCR